MLEQKLLGLVAWGLASDEDQVAGVPIINKLVPAPALGQRLAHLATLHPVRLEADGSLEGLEVLALAPVVDRDLFIVVAALPEPVVRWFPRNGRWLPLVTAANNLNASLVKPVEEGLEHGPGDRADLIPDDHPGDVLLTQPVRRPLVRKLRASLFAGEAEGLPLALGPEDHGVDAEVLLAYQWVIGVEDIRAVVLPENLFPVHGCDPQGDPEATFLQQARVTLFLDPCLEQLGDDHTASRLYGSKVFRHSTSPPRAAVPEEAVVSLCVDAPGPHLLGQAMGWGEDERLPPAEQLDGSRGLTGASATVEIAQSMPGERVGIGGRSAVRNVVASAPVLGFGLVCGVLLWRVDRLSLVPPLGWSDVGKSLFSKEAVQTRFVSAVAKHRGDVCLNAVELVEGCFFHVYAVCSDSNSPLRREPAKHLEKVNVRIRQHTSPEMGKLGLAAVVVRKDPASGAPFWRTYQRTGLTRFTDEEVKLALVCDKPACKPLAVGFGALRKLSDDRARLVPWVREPHLCLLLEGNDGLGNLELGQEARLDHVGKKSRGHPLLFLEVRAEPRRHNRVKAGGKLPAADLGEAGADVLRERSVNGDAGHAVSWVAEALKPWRGLSLALKARRVAGLHVDANHSVDVVVGGVPKTAVAVFHARNLHHVEEVDGRGIPDVLFAGDDARGVVLTEDPWGQGFGILWC